MIISQLISNDYINIAEDGLIRATEALMITKPTSNGWAINCQRDGTFVIERWESEDGEPQPSDAEVTSWRQSVTADIKMAVLRQQRDKLLAETDFWALSDTSDMTSEQTTYRQALRDLPSTVTADDITINDLKELTGFDWPVKP